MSESYDHECRNEDPPNFGPTPQAARATPLCARVVADGAMDLTPSVPRRTSVPGRGFPRSPPGGPRRIRVKPKNPTSQSVVDAQPGEDQSATLV